MWSVGCGYKTMKKLDCHTARVRFQLLFIFTVLSGTRGQTELSDCRVDIDTDWTVRGSCHYTKADVSRVNDINCTWYRQHNQGSVTLVTEGIVTGQLVTESSKTYYSGNCSFSVNVSTSHTGNHTFYIDFVPGPGRVETGQIEIVEPGKPESNCSERTVFPEGQDRSCDCTNSKSQPGSPPPTVGWRGSAPGQPLLLRDIKRSPIESRWFCEMTWGPEGNSIVKTTNISTVIVYGPDTIRISDGANSPPLTDLLVGQTATWRCQAFTVNSAARIEWTGVACDNGQTRTDCIFTAGRQDDGKTVTCTGRNNRFPNDLLASTSVRLNVTYPPNVPPEITGYINNTELTEGDNLTLTCTVRGGNPPVSSVTFSCVSDHHNSPNDTVVNSAVHNDSSVSSTVTIERLQAGDDGTTCVCGAEWPYGPDTLSYTLTSSVTLRVNVMAVTESTSTSRPQQQTKGLAHGEDAGEKINVGAVVGGSVGAVVAVIVTVVVVVVFVKRYLGRSIYAKPGPRLHESNYTDLVINDTVGDTNRASSHENKAANNDYENSGVKRTPGDDVHYQNTGSASQTAELNQYANSEVYAVSGGAQPVYQNTGAVSHTCAEGVYEDTSQM
ncbi:uncharacterized protein [Littorina saxatilis]|uniref:uncharacterized protein isoform X2 n=1 Tax=Littorina saxatilis TaxID=31220 RepID=UPI0038B4A298